MSIDHLRNGRIGGGLKPDYARSDEDLAERQAIRAERAAMLAAMHPEPTAEERRRIDVADRIKLNGSTTSVTTALCTLHGLSLGALREALADLEVLRDDTAVRIEPTGRPRALLPSRHRP